MDLHHHPEGIWAAFFMVIRIAMLITGTFLLTYTTSPILLTDRCCLLGPEETRFNLSNT